MATCDFVAVGSREIVLKRVNVAAALMSILLCMNILMQPVCLYAVTLGEPDADYSDSGSAILSDGATGQEAVGSPDSDVVQSDSTASSENEQPESGRVDQGGAQDGGEEGSNGAGEDAGSGTMGTLADDAAPNQEADAGASSGSDQMPAAQGSLQASASYRVHVQDYGWLDPVTDGEIAGTTGESKRVEKIEVGLTGLSCDGTVEVDAHVQDIGWQGYHTGAGGTEGQSKRIEALRIKLTGTAAEEYDICYRVHVQDIGWMGVAKNGEAAGTQGLGLRIEAVQIALVQKGADCPDFDPASSVSESFEKKPIAVQYSAHVSEIGWQGAVQDGAMAGTTGKSLGIEALKVSIANAAEDETGSILIRPHVQDIGWMDYSSNGSIAGTTGQAKHIEAVQIKLDGALAEKYDIYYRVHAANIGWMGWAKNDERAGTQGYGYAIEAIEIELIQKGSGPNLAPGSGEQSDSTQVEAFRQKPVDISYRAHVSELGWQGYVEHGATSGTTGRGLGLEALNVKLTNQVLDGDVEVRGHVSDVGWQDWVSGGATAGTTGQSRHLEAVCIKLTGQMSERYDVWYRVHASQYGWLGWTSNGSVAGTTGLGLPLEAIQVVLVDKGAGAPGDTAHSSISMPELSFQTISSRGWSDMAGNGGASGTTGQALALNGFKATISSQDLQGSIAYSAHLSDLGWQGVVFNGNLAGVDDASHQLEAIQMSLSGEVSNYFDIWYRVYIQDYGWLGWASNGAMAGTTSAGLRVEEMQVMLVAKGKGAPGTSAYKAYYVGCPGPQLLALANARQKQIVSLAHVVPSPGPALCSEWISQIFDRAGYGNSHLDACDMYWQFCHLTDKSQLKVGMLIAVPSHPHTVAGSIWGHVCLYIGDGQVMENIGYINTRSLDDWLSYYGATYQPKWGWYRNIALD